MVESLVEHIQFRSSLHYVSLLSFVSTSRICALICHKETFLLLLRQFSKVTGHKLIIWTNQSVVVTLLQASELIDLVTYHEVVTNNSVEMKEVHKKEAGDETASYSNEKRNHDC